MLTYFEKQNMIDMVTKWAIRVHFETNEVSFANCMAIVKDNIVDFKYGLTPARMSAMMVQVANGNPGFIPYTPKD